jgi:hypothetical protein
MSVTRNLNLGPSQMRLKRRRLFWIRFSIILFFLLVIVLGLAILSGHDRVKIKDINITGNAAVATDDVLAIVNSDLAGRYFYLFARSDYLIFPRFKIKKDLLQEIKTIKDVEISWDGWQKITINVAERKPHSVWCGLDPKTIQVDCYFMDKEGYIYSLAPTFTGSLFVRNYGPLIPKTDNKVNQIEPVGNYFIPTESYQQIFNLLELLSGKNIKVVSVYYDGMDYHFILDSGPEIIFKAQDGLNQSFANLFTALETGNLDLVKDAPKINYIDLRFDNKIVIGKK